MKASNQGNQLSRNQTVIVARTLLVAGALSLLATAWAQSIPQPGLAITSKSTGGMVITVTNGVNYASYDLYTTPLLADPDWTALAIGVPGQTNFPVVLGPYLTGFYQVMLDTNSVHYWQAANPTNLALGVLAVFIDSPTNGASLQ
jgi:hypothetical protein